MRLPFVLGSLALELLPVVAFVGVATMLLGTEIGDLPTARLVILAVVNAYALSRGLICAVRALAGPFGLFRVRPETAAYIEIWARRIVGVGVIRHSFCQCGVAARLASRRLRGVAASGDADRASLYRRHHPAVPPAGRRCDSRAGRPRGRSRQGAQPRRGLVALSCHRPGPRLVGGVGAEHPQRLLAAAAVFRRHHRGHIGRPPRHHGGAEPDRSRFPYQAGNPAAFPRPGDPRQSLSAAAAQDRLFRHHLYRLRCTARGLGRGCHRLVLWRPDRQSAVVGGRDDRRRRACGGGDLGGKQRADGSPAQCAVARGSLCARGAAAHLSADAANGAAVPDRHGGGFDGAERNRRQRRTVAGRRRNRRHRHRLRFAEAGAGPHYRAVSAAGKYRSGR